jgi:hypothetical protein
MGVFPALCDFSPKRLPPDADPYYSTPGGFDQVVDMRLSSRRIVEDATGEAPGTFALNTARR